MSLTDDDLSDTEWQHPDWARDADVVEDAGLYLADFDVVRNWVVKLTFLDGKNESQGSGFLLDLPDIEDRHIILTAAHNLSKPNGTLMTDVVVVYNNPAVTRCPVLPKDIYVGTDYKVAGKPEADYGVICISKTSSSNQRGFSFSMKLAYAEHFKGNVYVSGFQDITPDGLPRTSTGSCVSCYPTWMEYDTPTQEGFSGSPVWIEYGRKQMAVAIHNNSGRGARLSPDLFREIYSWLGSKVLLKDVQLRATDLSKKSTIPPAGLFLSFEQGFEFGRVRLRSGSKFDLMPAQVMSKKTLYAMSTNGEWALFDGEKVQLSKKVRDACLFEKVKNSPKKEHFRLVVHGGGRSLQLRMEANSILDADEDEETSEVSFVDWPGGDLSSFTKFLFEK